MSHEISIGERTWKVDDLSKVDKLKAKKAPEYNWEPVQSRIKIELMPETLSSIIATQTDDLFVRAKILALGPMVGYEDVVVSVRGLGDVNPLCGAKRQKLVDYKVGDIIIVNKDHILTYTGADKVKQTFVKDEGAIIAKGTEK